MEVFFWTCAGLIVIGLPALAMLLIYGALKEVKVYVETIQSRDNQLNTLQYSYDKLEIERDDFECERDSAIQEKEYLQERLDESQDLYNLQHTESINALRYDMLKKLYPNNELGFMSEIIRDYGVEIAKYDSEDRYEIIKQFFEKHPNPTYRR